MRPSEYTNNIIDFIFIMSQRTEAGSNVEVRRQQLVLPLHHVVPEITLWLAGLEAYFTGKQSHWPLLIS